MAVRILPAVVAMLAAIGLAPAAGAADLVRHAGGKFPIASAIEVPPGYTTVYLSGMGADVADKSAPAMIFYDYGYTET